MIETRIATTQDEKEAVFRFRYSVYVEEMGRYQSTADHENKRLSDPEDEHSWIIYAHDGTNVVGTLRITWGGHGFSPRQIDQYGMRPFVDELPAEVLAVGERTMISPTWRGGDLFTEMTDRSRELTSGHDVRVMFGACEPHLLSFYCRYQRPFAARNINSEEAGYLIPLISFTQGPEALVGLGYEPDALPRCVEDVLASSGTVTSPMLCEPASYWTQLSETLRRDSGSLFEDFSDEELERCVARSNIIDCAQGDRILKKGGAARNVFVVLAGRLVVRDGEREIGTVRQGEVFGETAFLLGSPRTFDVYAADPATRILSLSERTLRATTGEDASVAAKLFQNISKVLCSRLGDANARLSA